MTDSYNQNNINLGESTPLVVTTPDITPVLVTLGTIVDGQTLNIALVGGGSAPGALAANHYAVNILKNATFVREAGVSAVAGGAVALIQAGGPVVLTFVLDDVTTPGVTICQLSIVGPAFAYAHNLRYNSVQF